LYFNWDNEKNEELKKERNISFEQIIIAIEEDKIVDVLEHTNKDKYPNQILLLLNLNDYIYVVPTVVDEKKGEYFLKTIYPSRKYTNQYLVGDNK
jgi:uncharacterized DUF497 family protein